MTLKDSIERAHEQEAMERAHLRGEVHRLKEILKRIEWSAAHAIGTDVCPACYQEKDKGHDKECGIGKALKNG